MCVNHDSGGPQPPHRGPTPRLNPKSHVTCPAGHTELSDRTCQAPATGWQALQELHGLYLADDYDGALKALGRFCDLYETGELPEYHDTVDTIIAWTDEILAWHHTDRASNGRIEGTILWSVSEGVVDVADGYVAGSGGRVLWIVSSVSAMLLAA